jgi:tetratricopeptide (TPR) repeat protein
MIKIPKRMKGYLKSAKKAALQGDYTSALNELDIANLRFPNSHVIMARYSTVYFNKGDLEQAIGYARKAYELERSCVEANINLGKIYSRLAKEEEAEGELVTAKRFYARAAIHFKKVFSYGYSRLGRLRPRCRVFTARAFKNYLRLKNLPEEQTRESKIKRFNLEIAVQRALKRLKLKPS